MSSTDKPWRDNDEAAALIAAAKSDAPEIARKATDEVPKPAGFHLIPRRALTALAEHYKHGAEKYGRYNWEKGRPYSDYVDALERHLGAWLEGAELDEEGKPNLIAVAWLAFALYEFQHHHPELDDRRSSPVGETYRKATERRERGRREVEEELRLNTGRPLTSTGSAAFADWQRRQQARRA